MLNEMSPPEYDELPPLEQSATSPAEVQRTNALREAVAQVFQIESEDYLPEENTLGLAAVFTGQLLLDSEEAYDRLDALLTPLEHTALFRETGEDQMIHLIDRRFNPEPRAWWPNLLLFMLTVLSLMYVGAQLEMDGGEFGGLDILRGWPYALSISLILGAHELGHYFAAKFHGVPVTLPYFLPFPFGIFGTLGAFIQLRAPIRSRKVLFDIGAAGPLAGMIFAIPILMIGLATVEVGPLPTGEVYWIEGNSLLYALAKILAFGRFLPDGHYDLFLNQLTLAGWTGLFITGLNLIPVGQLDGGHIIYTLLGDRARALYFPAMAVIGLLVIFVSDAWFFWMFLLFMFGRAYAAPLDMITPLDNRRRMIAYLALVIFVLVFVPDPMRIVEPSGITGPLQSF